MLPSHLRVALAGSVLTHAVLGAHTVGSSSIVGIVSKAGVNRDSCTSVHFGTNALWTCRDSQPISNGVPALPITDNTAAWTNTSSGATPSLTQYGSTGIFYPVQCGGCAECSTSSAGACNDGTRWVGWPNAPPLVTIAYPNGDTGGYTWVNKQHLSGLGLAADSINYHSSLFYVEYQPTRDGLNLPQVTLVNSDFWTDNDVPYGSYGGVVGIDGYAYLYGQRADNSLALARVPAASVRDQTQYSYYVNNAWTTTRPARNATSATIANLGGTSQGTFYYSPLWNEWVFIGSSVFPGATWYMSTAPAPEGPWSAQYAIHSEKGGTAAIPAYSCVAHPGLTDGTGNSMYLSFTNVTTSSSGDVYQTPLILVKWAS